MKSSSSGSETLLLALITLGSIAVTYLTTRDESTKASGCTTAACATSSKQPALKTPTTPKISKKTATQSAATAARNSRLIVGAAIFIWQVAKPFVKRREQKAKEEQTVHAEQVASDNAQVRQADIPPKSKRSKQNLTAVASRVGLCIVRAIMTKGSESSVVACGDLLCDPIIQAASQEAVEDFMDSDGPQKVQEAWSAARVSATSLAISISDWVQRQLSKSPNERQTSSAEPL